MSPSKFSLFKTEAKQQRLHDLRLMPLYLPETLSIDVLKLEDRDGNKLALYQSDYNKLSNYLKKIPNPVSIDTFSKLPPKQKLEILDNAKVKIIKYFPPENLENCILDLGRSDFSSTGDIFNSAGVKLAKHSHQNCVVMSNNHIYIHPKVRSVLGSVIEEISSEKDLISTPQTKGLVGISHSSLSNNQRVQFAGSFVHDDKKGWVIDNRTGHYSTRAYQLRIFLDQLAKAGVPLELITVRGCVSKTGKTAPTDTDADYDDLYENARHYLDRVNASLESSTKRLTEGKSRRSSEVTSSESTSRRSSNSSESDKTPSATSDERDTPSPGPGK